MNFWILPLLTILIRETTVILRRLKSIQRRNAEWRMEDLACEGRFQIHSNWYSGLMRRKKYLLQSVKLAEEDQACATTHLAIRGNAGEERRLLVWNRRPKTSLHSAFWLVRKVPKRIALDQTINSHGRCYTLRSSRFHVSAVYCSQDPPSKLV